MNFSHEEAGRNKTSRVILPAHWERKPSNMNLSWLIAPWCWPRMSQKGKIDKKKQASCVWHLLPNIPTEDGAILTRGKCVTTARWKGFSGCVGQRTICLLKQIGIVFFLRYRLSSPSVLWHCRHDDCLDQAVCSSVAESYYTMEPGGNGMICYDVVSSFYPMGSLNLLLPLTGWPMARTIRLPFGMNLVQPKKCKHIRADDT